MAIELTLKITPQRHLTLHVKQHQKKKLPKILTERRITIRFQVYLIRSLHQQLFIILRQSSLVLFPYGAENH